MQEWTDLVIFNVSPVLNDEDIMRVLDA